jgi:hypothetical protein
MATLSDIVYSYIKFHNKAKCGKQEYVEGFNRLLDEEIASEETKKRLDELAKLLKENARGINI